MRIPFPLSLSAIALAGIMASPTADAALQSRTALHNPAQMCQMSLPSIDTKIRPRATGYNNEGTTNVFVICAPPSAEGGFDRTIGIDLWVASIDGQARSVSCTAVNGNYPGGADSVYVTKTVSVTRTPQTGGDLFRFRPADFGLGGTYLRPSTSITCTLPPKISINDAWVYSDTDIGS